MARGLCSCTLRVLGACSLSLSLLLPHFVRVLSSRLYCSSHHWQHRHRVLVVSADILCTALRSLSFVMVCSTFIIYRVIARSCGSHIHLWWFATTRAK